MKLLRRRMCTCHDHSSPGIESQDQCQGVKYSKPPSYMGRE